MAVMHGADCASTGNPRAANEPELQPEEAAVFQRLVSQRWSCRAFLTKPVPRHTIEQILDAAQKTASWCNTQPWQLELTLGEATERFRSELMAYADQGGARMLDFPDPEYQGVYQSRRRESGWKLYQAVGIAKGDRAASARQSRENLRFFGAPHVAIVTTAKALGPYGAIDCGAYIQVFMLAARAYGVASIAQAAIARYADFVRKHFSLAADRQVICAISFGYPDEAHPANRFRTTRASIDDATSWHT